MKFKPLAAIVLSAVLSGCAATFQEGEVLNKEFLPAEKGTPIVGYPPAALIATAVLNLATRKPDRYVLYLEGEKSGDGKILVKPDAYSEIRKRDWFVYTPNKEEFRELSEFSKEIKNSESK